MFNRIFLFTLMLHLVLLQGCYSEKYINKDEAINSPELFITKIVTEDGQEYEFEENKDLVVIKGDSLIVMSDSIKVIFHNNIREIYTEELDKTRTWLLAIGVVIVPLVVGFIIAFNDEGIASVGTGRFSGEILN